MSGQPLRQIQLWSLLITRFIYHPNITWVAAVRGLATSSKGSFNPQYEDFGFLGNLRVSGRQAG